jgi:hypothetical protein
MPAVEYRGRYLDLGYASFRPNAQVEPDTRIGDKCMGEFRAIVHNVDEDEDLRKVVKHIHVQEIAAPRFKGMYRIFQAKILPEKRILNAMEAARAVTMTVHENGILALDFDNK